MTDKIVQQTELKQTDAGLVPQGEGWFVLNARDASWIRSEERGQDTDFEGGQEWAELGFRIQVVAPGQRGVYHGERGQEDFLVVSGECVLVIEGEERRLKAWDFVHSPPWTKHVFVGAGDGPSQLGAGGAVGVSRGLAPRRTWLDGRSPREDRSQVEGGPGDQGSKSPRASLALSR